MDTMNTNYNQGSRANINQSQPQEDDMMGGNSILAQARKDAKKLGYEHQSNLTNNYSSVGKTGGLGLNRPGVLPPLKNNKNTLPPLN